jgi:hypothetical protein
MKKDIITETRRIQEIMGIIIESEETSFDLSNSDFSEEEMLKINKFISDLKKKCSASFFIQL